MSSRNLSKPLAAARARHAVPLLLLIAVVVFFGALPTATAQGRNRSTAPRGETVEVLQRDLAVTLRPDAHELSATATIRFKAVKQAGYVGFALSDNIFVRRVLNLEGVELEFDQSRSELETLSIRFSPPLGAGDEATVRIEYEGGFDSDRYSRIFSRDTANAYIGMEGTQLLEGAKWFPAARWPAERAPGSLAVTAPLGMTVIGPGEQAPVTTQGLDETFGWKAAAPWRAGAFVAGHYSLKKVQAGDFVIECYSRGNNPDAMAKSAEVAGKILAYFREAYGAIPTNSLGASGGVLRLVEVDDALARQSGMAGTVFVTRRELAGAEPPVVALARRIAAQWWSEAAGVAGAGDFWLADGLSYYSAARYLGAAGGTEAFKKEIDALAVLALKFENKSSVRDALELGYRSEQFESVAAGKGAWIINMLQGILGDEKFDRLLKDYFTAAAGSGVSGGDTVMFQKLAGNLHGKDLSWFFTEWLDTIGVPTLESDYVLFRTEEGFRISGAVKQGQDLFRMPVDIALVSGASGTDSTKDNTANNTKDKILTVELIGKSTPFDISSFAMPQKIVLDPKNKILRDSRELRTAVQLAMGDDLRQASNLVEAIRAYDDALKLSPQRSLAHFRLGETFFEQYNLQSAANAFRDSLNGDKEPGWIEVWCYIYLGKIYDILGQRQRALAEYTKALNTKDDTNGAQAEASRWQAAPYVRERGIDGGYAINGAEGTDGVDGASDGTGVPNDTGDAGDAGNSDTGNADDAGELTPQP